MIPEHRQLLAKKLFACALFYGKHDLSNGQVTSLLNVLVEFYKKPVEDIIGAIDAYMLDAKNRFFPAPAQLRPYLEPQLDQKDVAQSLTRDLIAAIKSHQDGWVGGYLSVNGPYWLWKGVTYPSWNAAATAQLGELGVAVINRYGWKNLCDSYFQADETIFYAQMRDYILATQRLAAQGHLHTKFTLIEKPRERATTGYLPINMLPETADDSEPA